MSEGQTWRKGYRRGSTVFKSVLKKNGKVDYYVCAVCGIEAKYGISYNDFHIHEIMHLLQRIRASHSGEIHELVFEGSDA